MSFLERELGVRFYTPRVTVAPKKTRYSFTGYMDPACRVPNDFYYEAFDPIWAARNRINDFMSHREQPGGVESYWASQVLLPVDAARGILRLTSRVLQSARRQTDGGARAALPHPSRRVAHHRRPNTSADARESGIPTDDVSQNDWANPCQCRDCQAIVDREGSQAGPVVNFVNQVADQVKAEFPDKFIGTLAYQYTRKPPRTLKPRENVVIRFCIECCFAHDFESCPQNRTFVEDMNGWAAIAPHIYIWDYVVNFSHYLLPFPNFRALKPHSLLPRSSVDRNHGTGGLPEPGRRVR